MRFLFMSCAALALFAGLPLSLALHPQPSAQDSPARPVEELDSRQEVLVEFVDAFNERDLDTLLGLADEDIQWLSVNGTRVVTEASGKRALAESLEAYFEGCPSCRSSLEWTKSAGTRVTALERASWIGQSGESSQISLSVYEFKGDKVARVYYFPAERPPPDVAEGEKQ